MADYTPSRVIDIIRLLGPLSKEVRENPQASTETRHSLRSHRGLLGPLRARMTGCHLETVLKVLVESGKKCETLLNDRMRGLHCEAIEMDELWSYVYKKQRVLTPEIG